MTGAIPGLRRDAAERLACRNGRAHMRRMTALTIRTLALLTAVGAGVALALALGSQAWEGLAPCALCLLERWPYRVAIVLAMLAALLPPHFARILLGVVVLALLADAGLGFVHIGVEAHWWPSPLPECAAPHFVAGSIAQRLASMPLHPAKPCDDPSYLIPGFPLSLAGMNLVYALAFAVALSVGLWRTERRPA
jgi:disulfide bond formation protein DsbB